MWSWFARHKELIAQNAFLNKRLQEAYDDAEETSDRLQNALSRIDGAEKAEAALKRVLDDNGLNGFSLEVAREIEGLMWAQHSGYAQRLARIQVIVRERLRQALTGRMSWSYSSDVTNATEPRG